jgi:hypothetical protein
VRVCECAQKTELPLAPASTEVGASCNIQFVLLHQHAQKKKSDERLTCMNVLLLRLFCCSLQIQAAEQEACIVFCCEAANV